MSLVATISKSKSIPNKPNGVLKDQTVVFTLTGSTFFSEINPLCLLSVLYINNRKPGYSGDNMQQSYIFETTQGGPV